MCSNFHLRDSPYVANGQWPHRPRRLSRLAAKGQRFTRRLAWIACNVLLPMANKILLSPCHLARPCTLHVTWCHLAARPLHAASLVHCQWANGQRDLDKTCTKMAANDDKLIKKPNQCCRQRPAILLMHVATACHCLLPSPIVPIAC